jgi:hypothetical protein
MEVHLEVDKTTQDGPLCGKEGWSALFLTSVKNTESPPFSTCGLAYFI